MKSLAVMYCYTVGDAYLLTRTARKRAHTLDVTNYVHAVRHAAEDYMAGVQPRRLRGDGGLVMGEVVVFV